MIEVEMSRWAGCDEELCVARVVAAFGHGGHSRAGVAQVDVELIVEAHPRAFNTQPVGTAALDHEILDHAMEDQPVVVLLLGQLDDPSGGVRCPPFEHLEHHVAAGKAGEGGHGDPQAAIALGNERRQVGTPRDRDAIRERIVVVIVAVQRHVQRRAAEDRHVVQRRQRGRNR